MHLLIGWPVLFFVVVLTKGDHCKEDDLKACLFNLQKLLEDEYKFVKKSDEELNEHCLSVAKKNSCLKDLSDSCKKEHRLIAALSSALSNHLNQLCSQGMDRTKVYKNMLTCFEAHEKEFVKCSDVEISGKLEDPLLKNVCLDMKSMLCVASASRKVCFEDGEMFAKSLEYGVKDSFSEACNGLEGMAANAWILILSTLYAILLKQRAV